MNANHQNKNINNPSMSMLKIYCTEKPKCVAYFLNSKLIEPQYEFKAEKLQSNRTLINGF